MVLLPEGVHDAGGVAPQAAVREGHPPGRTEVLARTEICGVIRAAVLLNLRRIAKRWQQRGTVAGTQRGRGSAHAARHGTGAESVPLAAAASAATSGGRLGPLPAAASAATSGGRLGPLSGLLRGGRSGCLWRRGRAGGSAGHAHGVVVAEQAVHGRGAGRARPTGAERANPVPLLLGIFLLPGFRGTCEPPVDLGVSQPQLSLGHPQAILGSPPLANLIRVPDRPTRVLDPRLARQGPREPRDLPKCLVDSLLRWLNSPSAPHLQKAPAQRLL